MSDEKPEPFKVTVHRPNGESVAYVLMKKDVVLRGGKIQPIRYFVKEGAPSRPDPNQFEYIIHETPREDMPDGTLEVVGRAMMEYLGMSAEVAAEANGRLIADVRGYGKEQRSEAIDELRRKLLANPPQ